MDKRKFGDVLFYMIMCAIQDRASLIDAYDNDESNEDVIEAKQDIRRFMNIRKKLFPSHVSKMENIISNANKVTLSELKNMLDDKLEE